VAACAFTLVFGMGGWGQFSMTGCANGADLLRTVFCCAVRIVAGATPELAAGSAGAFAFCEFFDLADRNHLLLTAAGQDIGGESPFRRFTWVKVGPAFSGVWNACRGLEVALFADTVAFRPA
jgi:hypothetical protein